MSFLQEPGFKDRVRQSVLDRIEQIGMPAVDNELVEFTIRREVELLVPIFHPTLWKRSFSISMPNEANALQMVVKKVIRSLQMETKLQTVAQAQVGYFGLLRRHTDLPMDLQAVRTRQERDQSSRLAGEFRGDQPIASRKP